MDTIWAGLELRELGRVSVLSSLEGDGETIAGQQQPDEGAVWGEALSCPGWCQVQEPFLSSISGFLSPFCDTW